MTEKDKSSKKDFFGISNGDLDDREQSGDCFNKPVE